MVNPKVTVVVPLYNREALLADTLRSVQAQSFTDWECVVVDDGSTDESASVARRFADGDPRFRYMWQENGNVGKARNRGIAMARAPFVLFLDSDDLLPPDAMEWQAQFLTENPEVVLVYGDAFHFSRLDPLDGFVYMERIKDKPDGDGFERLLSCSAIYSPMVRASALARAGGFDPDLHSAEDWDMWLSVAAIGRIAYRPRLSLYYRVHANTKSGNTLQHCQLTQRVARKHLKTLPAERRGQAAARVRRYIRRIFPQRLVRDARDHGEDGDWQTARRLWRAAVYLRPSLMLQPDIAANVTWAWLPIKSEPFWRRVRRRRNQATTDPGSNRASPR